MYNPVNAHVVPSKFLVTSLYGLHGILLVASLSIPAVFYYYLIPIFAVQCWHIFRIRRQDFLYLQVRHWRFHNDQWFVTLKDNKESQVEVELHHLWPFLAIFRFKQQGRWHWEMIVSDALDAESFRQLRARLRISHKA
ncbi:MAG: protein YgfX [Bermanella sp.]